MQNNDQNIETLELNSNEPFKFARDIVWIFLSQAVIGVLGIFYLSTMTKNYPTEIYGIFVLMSNALGLLSPVLYMCFDSTVVRFLSGEKQKEIRRRGIGSMLLAILVLELIVCGGTFLFAPQLSQLIFNNAQYVHYVLLTFFWAFVDAIYYFFLSYLRASDRIGRYSIIQAALCVLKLLVLISAGLSEQGLEFIVIGWIILELIFSLYLLGLITRNEGFPFPNFGEIRKYLAFSVPQIPCVILLWIMGTSDRYFITHFWGLSQTGIYSSSNTLGSLISLTFAPISFVLFPFISRAWEQKQINVAKNYFEYSTKLFLMIAIPAAAGLTVLSQSLLRILTTHEYLAGWTLVLLVSIGTIFSGIFNLNVYIILLIKKTVWLPLLMLVSSAVSIGLNVFLIPRIGIAGSAIANIASFFVLAFTFSLVNNKVTKYKLDFIFVVKVIVASLVMTGSIFFMKSDNILETVSVIIVGTAVYIIAVLLMKVLSNQDKQILKLILSRFIPSRRLFPKISRK
jgi:O-antigen/teichoic acid export membrane protein